MLESEAKKKLCPITSFRESGLRRVCAASGCMMWAWKTPEYDYTLEENLDRNPKRPKDGWEEREDGLSGWRRPTPQEQRHGSCGLANNAVERAL